MKRIYNNRLLITGVLLSLSVAVLSACASDKRQQTKAQVVRTADKAGDGMKRSGNAIKKGFSRAGDWVGKKVEAIKK